MNNFDTGLFLITLKMNRSVKDIMSIKYILDQVISWEQPKASLKVPQCYRCQQWGHLSKNCNRPVACLKCDKQHPRGECALASGGNESPFCVNCKQLGHTSNYRGCSAYKQYIEIKKKRIEEIKAQKKTAATNVRNEIAASNVQLSGSSYASIVKNSKQALTKPTIIEEFLKIAHILCPPETLTLEDKIKNFMTSYKTLPKEKAKLECFNLLNDVRNLYGP